MPDVAAGRSSVPLSTSSRKGELLRGLGWNVPAAIGGPVDLIEQAINLGLAGGGYLGHKAGLVSAENLPRPLEGSPGTTKWWTKGTPLEESSDPAFVRGQIAGALAPGVAKMLPSWKPSGTLRSVIVPEEWLAQHGIPDRTPGGAPLGRLAGDLPGTKHAALTRQQSADETFNAATLSQLAGGQKIPLEVLAPEVRGTPLAGVRVVAGQYAASPLGSKARAHADPQNNEIAMGLAGDPRQLLSTLHHEATHLADFKGRKPSVGAAYRQMDDPSFLRGLERLRQKAPQWAGMMEDILKNPAQRVYEGNLGEVRARTAGASANMIAPSSLTLEILNSAERAGRPLSTQLSNLDTATGAIDRVLLPPSVLPKLQATGTTSTGASFAAPGGGHLGWIGGDYSPSPSLGQGLAASEKMEEVVDFPRRIRPVGTEATVQPQAPANAPNITNTRSKTLEQAMVDAEANAQRVAVIPPGSRFLETSRARPTIYDVVEGDDRSGLMRGLAREQQHDKSWRSRSFALNPEQLLGMEKHALQPGVVTPQTAQRYYGGEQQFWPGQLLFEFLRNK